MIAKERIKNSSETEESKRAKKEDLEAEKMRQILNPVDNDSNEALKAGDETDNDRSVKKEGEENPEFYLEH